MNAHINDKSSSVLNELKFDHHYFGSSWDLFHFEQHSPGMVFWHPRGFKMLKKLEESSRKLYEAYHYQEVRSPQLLDQSLWVQSGHWEKYHTHMFIVQNREEMDESQSCKIQALKPMSCPGHIAIFKQSRRSYRELPYRLFEFGNVHRNEASGALNGLFRLRNFVQDDSHLFLELHQIQNEVQHFIKMVQQAYAWFDFKVESYRIALRPENRAGSDEDWDKAEEALRQACSSMHLPYEEAPGEGAFYGPKLEVGLKDRLGRLWQSGVMQVDFVLPKRFNLQYMGSDGKFHQPVMLHQAIFGSLERWMGIVLEHHGSHVPLWLSPEPLVILPVQKKESSELHQQSILEYAQSLQALARQDEIALSLDVDDSPLKQRIKNAFERQVPWVMIIGEQEVKQEKISLRNRAGQQIEKSREDFFKELKLWFKYPF